MDFFIEKANSLTRKKGASTPEVNHISYVMFLRSAELYFLIFGTLVLCAALKDIWMKDITIVVTAQQQPQPQQQNNHNCTWVETK